MKEIRQTLLMPTVKQHFLFCNKYPYFLPLCCPSLFLFLLPSFLNRYLRPHKCQAPCYDGHAIINKNKAGSCSKQLMVTEEADTGQIIMKISTSSQLQRVQWRTLASADRLVCVLVPLTWGGSGFAMCLCLNEGCPVGLFAGAVFWEVLFWVHSAQ